MNIMRSKAGIVASTALRPTSYRSSSVTLNAHFDPTLITSASTRRPGIAPHFRLNASGSRISSGGHLSKSRQASSSALSGNGGLNHTALHELHLTKGGKMVPFAGYSMPVHYSDLGVGESHRWTREKASLFDVGHM